MSTSLSFDICIMLILLMLTNRLYVCDSDEPQDEKPVQSDTVLYDKDDELSSLDIAMLGDKTVSPPTVYEQG